MTPPDEVPPAADAQGQTSTLDAIVRGLIVCVLLIVAAVALFISFVWLVVFNEVDENGKKNHVDTSDWLQLVGLIALAVLCFGLAVVTVRWHDPPKLVTKEDDALE